MNLFANTISAAVSDVGYLRPINEDNYLLDGLNYLNLLTNHCKLFL